MSIYIPGLDEIVEHAIREDLGLGDVTTDALIPPELAGKGAILVKAKGVLAGRDVAALVFHKIDQSIGFKALKKDGSRLNPGDVIAQIEGSAGSILRGERTALNFLQRLSGIATETARYVEAVSGLKAKILDTRKTAPGLRALDKYAVRVGGGHNHRFHLGDGVLIKDNHLAALRSQGTGIREAIARARLRAPHSLKIEVEAGSLEEAKEALDAEVDALLLDNMPIEEMRRIVQMAKGQALLEASGGITLANVRAVAETGVDLISVGALTHSTRALDMSLELESGHSK